MADGFGGGSAASRFSAPQTFIVNMPCAARQVKERLTGAEEEEARRAEEEAERERRRRERRGPFGIFGPRDRD